MIGIRLKNKLQKLVPPIAEFNERDLLQIDGKTTDSCFIFKLPVTANP